MWQEVGRLTKRINDGLVTTAVLTQAAIISVMDKKGNKAFKELIEKLGGVAPAAEVEAPKKKGRTTHADREAAGKRDARIPKPPKRQSTT